MFGFVRIRIAQPILGGRSISMSSSVYQANEKNPDITTKVSEALNDAKEYVTKETVRQKEQPLKPTELSGFSSIKSKEAHESGKQAFNPENHENESSLETGPQIIVNKIHDALMDVHEMSNNAFENVKKRMTNDEDKKPDVGDEDDSHKPL